MDAQFSFADYQQQNAFIQYPTAQAPNQSRHDEVSGRYYSYTPAFSPGSSSTTPSTPAIPTPPPFPTEILPNSAYQGETQLIFGGWDGSIGAYYNADLPLFHTHINTNVPVDAPSDTSYSRGCFYPVPPQQHGQPPSSTLPASPIHHSHNHIAGVSIASNHPPRVLATSRFAPPVAVDPNSTDQFRTHWDARGNLARTPVPTTCRYEGCSFVGLPDTLWGHIVDVHHAGTKSTTHVLCGWDGCAPTASKSTMKRGNLLRHIMDTHLSYVKLHCPYCHYTSRDTEYAQRHGDDPALCSERATWEAHEGEGWTKTAACQWCQAIAIP